jgi:hypothetical protein
MNNKLLWLVLTGVVLAAALGIFLVNGCGVTNNGGGSTSHAVPLFEMSANTTPVFTPTSLVSAASTWGSGNTMYGLFYALREYVHSRDTGLIDRANIYRLFYDVETLFDAMSGAVVPLPVPKVIKPPFDFSNNITYSSAVNNETNKMAAAMTQEGNVTKGIVTWIWTDGADSHKEYGVMETVIDQVSKDVTIDFVFSVDYTPNDTLCDYNNRTRITGNSGTHSFQFIQTLGGSLESSPLSQLVGKGISRGAGNHFLFKVKNGNGDGFAATRYVVISAEATEATLRAFNVSAEAYSDPALLPASVADYKNDVVSASFYAFSDLLVNLSTLNQGNAKAGTIYLDY